MADGVTTRTVHRQANEVVQVDLIGTRLRQFQARREHMTIAPPVGLVAILDGVELDAESALERLGHLDVQRSFRDDGIAFDGSSDQSPARYKYFVCTRSHRLNDYDSDGAVGTSYAADNHQILRHGSSSSSSSPSPSREPSWSWT